VATPSVSPVCGFIDDITPALPIVPVGDRIWAMIAPGVLGVLLSDWCYRDWYNPVPFTFMCTCASNPSRSFTVLGYQSIRDFSYKTQATPSSLFYSATVQQVGYFSPGWF
jgi:hypothetical protein